MPSHKGCPRCQSYLPASDGCLRIAHGLKCTPPAEEPSVTLEEEEAFHALANKLELTVEPKYWLCCGSRSEQHACAKMPDCFSPKARFGTAQEHTSWMENLLP